MGRRQIIRAADQGAAEDQHGVAARRLQRLDVRGQRAAPVRADDGIVTSLVAGGAHADIGKIVPIQRSQLQGVVALGGIGHRDDHRLLCQIEPGDGVQRVAVGAAAILVAGIGQRAQVPELVERHVGRTLGVARLGDPEPAQCRQIHPGVADDVGLDAQRIRVFLAPVHRLRGASGTDGDGWLRVRRRVWQPGNRCGLRLLGEAWQAQQSREQGGKQKFPDALHGVLTARAARPKNRSGRR